MPALLLLRPALILALVLLAVAPGRWDIAPVRTPLLLLGGLALLMLLQLVPLPPGLWTALPGRALHAEAAAAAGVAQPWRPISLTPYLTMNSLLALLPAAVALIGMARLRDDQRRAMLPVLIGLACASALLGIVQLGGPPGGPAYLYEITHSGSAVGVFANRNHQAALIAIAFPMLRVWTLQARDEETRYRFRLAVAAAVALLLVPMLVATGSRVGVVLGLAGIAAALLLAPLTGAAGRTGRSRLLAAAAWTAPAALALLAVALGRGLAIERLADGDLGAEPRLTHLPVLVEMAKAFFPVGTGFGAFDPVFRSFEPDWALSLRYFNHAHNEPIELLLTGGVAALLILLGFLLWWGRRAMTAFARAQAGPPPLFARLGLVIVAMLLLSSLVEYSLRTPLMGMVFAIACAWAAAPARAAAAQDEETPPRRQRPPRRMLGMGLAVLAGLGAVIGSTVVTAQLVARPGTGAAFLAWPGGGSAGIRAAAAAASIGPGAGPADIARARQLAGAALAQEPTNVVAARTLGLAAMLENREADAARLFAFAERLSRRDLPTQLWLIEDRVRRNDVAGALVHYDRALRTSPEAHAILLPILVEAAASPGIAEALAGFTARRPPWARPFAARLFREGGSPAAIATIARSLGLDPRLPADAALLRRAQDRLVRLNAPELAWDLHARASGGGAVRAAVRNGTFEDAASEGPFDWSLTAAPGLVARASPIAGRPGLALHIAADGGHGAEAARQLLALVPGRYRLDFEAGRAAGEEAARLIVRIACANGGRVLLLVEAAGLPSSGRAFRQPFEVPAECAGQRLSIAVADGPMAGRAELWIDSVAIGPAAR